MALLLTLARGAVTGVGKRPSPRAALPDVRLTEPGVRIDAGRVAAYARVCGYPVPADGGDTVPAPLPLTYPHILGFPLAARIMAARGFPLPLMGLVHTSVDIVAGTPLTTADRPELAVHAAELRPHRRGTEVVMVTEALLGGETVWTDRSTYLARHRVDEAQAAAAEPPAPSEPLPVTGTWRLPADLGRRHARVSGDYNPIHLHPVTARPLGFPRAIVHGMWTVARCAAETPGATRITADFRKPVLLPSTVEYAARGERFEVRSRAGLHMTGLTES
ncbi:MaoC family dehydratase [Actinacidiphila rubida]|uniref:Acyl dehydratase n=1 Tax=Actinacidiphila rubida TaxID=310780 RepID=A0A1H8MBE0_9ACTN|nr:MaoC family dehydratase [Actinacidiphila rubida]SEO14538.1 Acyl dehydratase [Actinacidiphila rubida]